jgi:hypothetical protein
VGQLVADHAAERTEHRCVVGRRIVHRWLEKACGERDLVAAAGGRRRASAVARTTRRSRRLADLCEPARELVLLRTLRVAVGVVRTIRTPV